MARRRSLPNYFASKTQSLQRYYYFLAVGNKKFQRVKCDSYTRMMQMNPPDDWLKTGWARDSQTRTRLMDSLFCIKCSVENNAVSVLHYFIKLTLHCLRDSFCLGTFAHGFIRLPPRSLASSRRCSFSIIEPREDRRLWEVIIIGINPQVKLNEETAITADCLYAVFNGIKPLWDEAALKRYKSFFFFNISQLCG